MKKIAVVLLSIIALSCNTPEKKSTLLMDYIPKDAEIIIKINDLEQAKSKLRDNDFIKNNAAITLFDFFKKHPVLDETTKPEGLLCFSPLGKNDYEYTYIARFDRGLLNMDSLQQKKIETISYSEKIIHKISTKGNTYYITLQDSILIASSSQLFIENTIRQEKDMIPVSVDLKKAYEVSGTNNALSVLINGKKLNNIHNTLLPNTKPQGLSNFSGWISVDATIDQNAVYFDGIAIEKDSLSSTIAIFDNTIAQENQIAKITPVTAKGFVSFTYDDFIVLKKNLALAQDRLFTDIPKDLDEILSETYEIGTIYLENDSVFTLTLLDSDGVLEKLDGTKVNTYRNVSIYSYQNTTSFSDVLTPLLSDFETKFYFLHDKHLVLGSSKESLQTIIANILNKTVLYEQSDYREATEKLATESSILITGTVPHLKDYISEGVIKERKKEWNELKDEEYKTATLQVIKEGNFAHTHGVFQKIITKGGAATVTQTASTSLENKILNKPVLVKNHRTKDLDIAMQDIDNILYLISDNGSIFWKKQIDGAIMGAIQQIDIYKNGRYQLLFNTANTLYIVDRDGKDVSPYPKKFDKNITQPLALFDYDKNKEYRIIITQGNTISMFNAKGEIVKGFRSKGTTTNLVQSPKHIRIKNKDYILLPEENGTLNIIDRLGKPRIQVKDKIDFSENEWYQYQDKFTSTTKNGKLVQIHPNGTISYENLYLAENSRLIATNKSLATFSENKLTIKGKTIELDFGVYSEPKLFYINDKIYVSITDKQSKKVYLYDSNAVLLPNFPVYGSSVMHLGNMDNDSNLEFVVQGEENSILIYQIN